MLMTAIDINVAFAVKGGTAHNSVLWLPPILEDYLLFTVLWKVSTSVIKGRGTAETRLRNYFFFFVSNASVLYYRLLQMSISLSYLLLDIYD